MGPDRDTFRRQLTIIALGALIVALVCFGAAVWIVAATQQASAERAEATSPLAQADAAASTQATASTLASGSADASGSAATSASAAASASAAPSAPPTPAPAPAAAPAARATVSAGPSIDAYRGLAAWVDIYETRAWNNPEAAVADMANHGVRTLFIETANFHAADPVFQPAQMSRFIVAAHAHGMKIVAWYLPNMKAGSVDYARALAAIRYRTSGGQAFDSFALDIEDTSVSSEAQRNANLIELSHQIRSEAGASYPLGAIIPSPVGLARAHSAWGNFPYSALATIYDVYVPMGYYTYHGKGASAVIADVRGNISIIRSKPGCATIPVHIIGGIAGDSSDADTRAFAQGVMQGGFIGASIYSWSDTSAGDWTGLSALRF